MWTTIDPLQPAFRCTASTVLVRIVTFTIVPACGALQTHRLSVLLMTWSGAATAGVTSPSRCCPRWVLVGFGVFAGFAGFGARFESVWAIAVVAVAARAATASVRARGERCKGFSVDQAWARRRGVGDRRQARGVPPSIASTLERPHALLE